MAEFEDRSKWSEFDWEKEFKKDDARVNAYLNELSKYIDLPEEDTVIMNKMKKRSDLVPSGGDWDNLGPVPYDDEFDGDDDADDTPPPPENEPETEPDRIFHACNVLVREWACFFAANSDKDISLHSMRIICLYGKLMARTYDLIDMERRPDDDDDWEPAPPAIRKALLKRLANDLNNLAGELFKMEQDFPAAGEKCQSHRDMIMEIRTRVVAMLLSAGDSNENRVSF